MSLSEVKSGIKWILKLSQNELHLQSNFLPFQTLHLNIFNYYLNHKGITNIRQNCLLLAFTWAHRNVRKQLMINLRRENYLWAHKLWDTLSKFTLKWIGCLEFEQNWNKVLLRIFFLLYSFSEVQSLIKLLCKINIFVSTLIKNKSITIRKLSPREI